MRRSSGTRFRHNPAAWRIACASRIGASQRLVARHRAEVVEAQLDAHGASRVALAREVPRQPLAELREDLRQLGAIARGGQVALEGGLAADRHRLALGHDVAIVLALRHAMQPRAVVASELVHEPREIGVRELADRGDAELVELGTRLGADAVDAPGRQRPDPRDDVGGPDDGEAVGLVELRGDLGEELVGRHRHRAREPGRVAHRRLERLGDVARAPPGIDFRLDVRDGRTPAARPPPRAHPAPARPRRPSSEARCTSVRSM